MGMSAEEYWHGSPELTRAYIKAYRIQKEERNWEMWLQGWYIHNATIAALSHIGKGKIVDYIEEPVPIFPPTEEEIEEQRQKEAELLEKRLNAFMRNFNGQ